MLFLRPYSRNSTSSDRDQDFYEKFHDTCRHSLGEFVKSCMENLPSHMATAGRNLTQKQLRMLDKVHQVEQENAALDKKVNEKKKEAAIAAESK